MNVGGVWRPIHDPALGPADLQSAERPADKRPRGSGRSRDRARAVRKPEPAVVAAQVTWKQTTWRSSLVLLFLMAALAAVWVRSFTLQHVQGEEWQQRAEARFERLRPVQQPRGALTDRQGITLAVSISQSRLAVVPRHFKPDHPKLPQLARLLGEPEAKLRRRLGKAERYTVVAHELDLKTADQIRALKIPGLEVEEELRRRYPQGEAMAPLIGLVSHEGVGVEGLERHWESRLHATAGHERVMVDRRNQAFGERLVSPGAPGQPVRLSVDADLQALAYGALSAALDRHEARGAAAVVVDVRTGEILAMASAPSLDPNSRGRLDANRLRNRAVMDSLEPGSTLKPFSVGAALEAGLIQPNTRIQTGPGTLTVNRRTIRDTKPHGLITVSEVVQLSSNVGTGKIALMQSPQQMHALYSRAGLGTTRPLDLPGAVSGRLRDPSAWAPIDQVVMSYGHGVAVSLVQLASAYTAIARQDGARVGLRLEPLPEGQRPATTPVFSPETAAALRRMLEAAAGPAGTAPKAQIEGFRVAGKTGTAHKPSEGGYARDRYISSFVGFVPAQQPRLVVAVMVDEPRQNGHYGGVVAAPIFAEIASAGMRQLQMSPDPAIRVQPSDLLVEEGT